MPSLITPLLALSLAALPGGDPVQQARPIGDQILDLSKVDLSKAKYFAVDGAFSTMPQNSEALDMADPEFKGKSIKFTYTITAPRRHAFLIRVPANSRLRGDIDNARTRVSFFIADPTLRATDPGSRNTIKTNNRAYYRNGRAEAVSVICEVSVGGWGGIAGGAGVEAYNLSILLDK